MIQISEWSYDMYSCDRRDLYLPPLATLHWDHSSQPRLGRRGRKENRTRVGSIYLSKYASSTACKDGLAFGSSDTFYSEDA